MAKRHALIPALVLAASAAHAQPRYPDLTFDGVLQCAPVPSVSLNALSRKVTGRIVNGNATMAWQIATADTNVGSGYWEIATGDVERSGALTLRGSAKVPGGASYTAEYAGTLPPRPDVVRFTGTQRWTLPGSDPVERPCTLTLRLKP